jgi:hypothetical protein
MPEYKFSDVMEALRNADASGNKEDAHRLAVIADKMQKNKDAPKADPGGGVMPYVNRGIAQGFGAPADIIRSGLNLIPGVNLPKPFGGSDAIIKTMNFLGIKTAPGDQAPDTVPEHMGQVVGEVAALLNPATLGVRGLAQGANLTGKVASGVWQSMIKHPYLTMTSELTGASAAGAARGVAQKEFPDSPGIQTGLETAAGMAGSLAPTALVHTPTAMTIRAGKNVLHKVLLPFTKKGGRFRAGEHLKGLVPDAGDAAKKVAEDTISGLPPAVASGEKKIIATYKALLGQDPLADAEAIEKLTGSIIKLEGEMRKMGYGSPELLEEITKKRVAALELRMDRRVLDAATRAQKKLDSIPTANRKAAESKIVRAELEGAMRAERTKVNEAWAKVDKDIQVGFEKTRKTYAALYADLGVAQRIDIPSSLKSNPIINGKKLKATTVREMQSLRSKLLETARIARKEGQWNKARIAENVSDAILDDMDKVIKPVEMTDLDHAFSIMGDEVSQGSVERNAEHIIGSTYPAWFRNARPKWSKKEFNAIMDKVKSGKEYLLTEKQSARYRELEEIAEGYKNSHPDIIGQEDAPESFNFGANVVKRVEPAKSDLTTALAATRQFKMRFESGDVGKILGYSRTGAPAINPDLTLEMTVGRMGERGAVDLNKIVVTPEARQATQRYLARSFTDYANPQGSGLSQVKADRWIKTNEAILDQFPGLKKQLSDASSAQGFADNVKFKMAERKKLLQNPKISESARFLNRADMGQEISGILKSRRPSRTAMELVRQARKDPSGSALEGLRAGFIEDALGKSTLGPSNELGQQTLSGRALLGYVNKNEPTLRAVFTDNQIARMKRIGSELSKIETFDRISAGKTGIELKDTASSAMRMFARLTGARLGGKLGSGSMGGSLQYASVFSSRAQKFITWLSKDTAEQLVNDAILSKDPALLKSLLKPMAKPTPKKSDMVSLNKNLNLWLSTTGKRVIDDIERDEQQGE